MRRRSRDPSEKLPRAEIVGQFAAIGFFVGVFTFAAGAPRRRGGQGLIPPKVKGVLFFGGIALWLLSVVVGCRSGTFARFNTHYNEETGRIEGHWMGRIQDLVDPPDSKGSDGPSDRED
ncbi:hypothetical protein [Haloarchaeobius sp. TZWSO28]|uniref:hypothetical protein n=1 Tax=Haloarchaeobius sp. TZWSO28 TaxID=3446119 RepID=UPI003EB6A2DE